MSSQLRVKESTGTERPMRRHLSHAVLVRQRQHLTTILCVVPCVFVLLNLPSYAMRMYNFLKALTNPSSSPSPLETFLSQFSLLLYYTSYSTNFMVYCMSSKNFRKAAINLAYSFWKTDGSVTPGSSKST